MQDRVEARGPDEVVLNDDDMGREVAKQTLGMDSGIRRGNDLLAGIDDASLE